MPNQGIKNAPYHVNVHSVPKRLVSTSLCVRQAKKLIHALQTATFSWGHEALLPSDDRHLARSHRDQRRRSILRLDPDAACPKLDDMIPDAALGALTVPFKLLEARRKLFDAVYPWVNDRPVSGIERAVLLDKIDLPVRKTP